MFKNNSLKLALYMISAIFLFQCQSDRHIDVKKKISVVTNTIATPLEINAVNFYFENSGSMNGYLNGDNFLETMTRILGSSGIENLNTFFVNTDVHKTENLLDNIENKKIAVGNIKSSDHQFIFKTAIETAIDNNLSIVVTDGIYSVKGKNPNIVSVKIEQTFVKALNENSIETVVLKMQSNFRGVYYSETCKPGSKSIKINQTRPYYIFLFGNKQVINKALKKIVILNDLKGQEELARFMITKNLSVNYTVLTQGEEKQGYFKQINRTSVVKEIGEAEKFSRRGVLLKDTYLQFGIAVDFSKIAIPKSYIENISNYSILDNTGYRIEEIKKIGDLDKTTKSYKWIEAQNKIGKLNYTHIIVVRAKEKIYGDLSLSLNINFPEWIREAGTSEDCEIVNDTKSTFAFDRLMIGISKAYKRVAKKDEFFRLKIKIKAN